MARAVGRSAPRIVGGLKEQPFEELGEAGDVRGSTSLACGLERIARPWKALCLGVEGSGPGGAARLEYDGGLGGLVAFGQ